MGKKEDNDEIAMFFFGALIGFALTLGCVALIIHDTTTLDDTFFDEVCNHYHPGSEYGHKEDNNHIVCEIKQEENVMLETKTPPITLEQD